MLGTRIEQFLQRYSSTCDLSTRTRRAYRTDLKQFCAHVGDEVELESITAEHAEDWAAELKARGLQPATLKRKFAVLRVFLNYWVRRGELERSPLQRLRLDLGRSRKLVRTLDLEEIERLLATAQRAAAESRDLGSRAAALAVRNRALIEVLFSTGMRVGEVAALTLDDVVNERTIRVHGKGARERLALLTDTRAVEALSDYLELRRTTQSSSSALFLGVRGHRLSEQGIARVVSVLAQQAGINRRVTPHMFRHTVATLLLRNGANMRVVQEFLGHASITTTERYTHVSKAHLAATLQQHHPRLSL